GVQTCALPILGEEVEPHLQELRRGTVVLACLQLLRTPGYGHGRLEDLQAAGFDTEANTLSPLLRRLEKQGHLTRLWNTEESRPRKFYQTSTPGQRLADVMRREWNQLTQAIDALPHQEDPPRS